MESLAGRKMRTARRLRRLLTGVGGGGHMGAASLAAVMAMSASMTVSAGSCVVEGVSAGDGRGARPRSLGGRNDAGLTMARRCATMVLC